MVKCMFYIDFSENQADTELVQKSLQCSRREGIKSWSRTAIGSTGNMGWVGARQGGGEGKKGN